MKNDSNDSGLPFTVGDKVLIRTVTLYQLGVVRRITDEFIELSDGGWVADMGRFGEALATGKVNEFERAPSWCLVARGSIVDIHPWAHEIPKVTK
jgi:hypothetical protein